MWLCALAYWQLLLMRNLVTPNRPAWHPRRKDGQVHPLTPAQVQRSALPFCCGLAHLPETPDPQEKDQAGKTAIGQRQENAMT